MPLIFSVVLILGIGWFGVGEDFLINSTTPIVAAATRTSGIIIIRASIPGFNPEDFL